MAFSIQTYAIAKKYTDETAAQFGGLKGASCKIASITKSNGRNVVTFEWKNDEGETRTSTMNVDDGTPIYTWTAGDSYKYGDLVIYASCFYRCITPNSDVTFDDTKWNEIGSPDGNYDIIQDASQLPERFTEADRKMYYSIEDGAFWLWDGTQWVLQENGGGQTYTAGKYINIDANNEISVDRVVPNEAFTYTIKQIDDYSFEVIKTVDNVDVFDETYSCWDPTTQTSPTIDETFDNAISIHLDPGGARYYELIIASDTHEAGFKQTTPWYARNTYTEVFSTVDHSGEKLIIKSELDAALASKADISDLANKQDVLTEGTYIDISSNTISVQRDITHDVDEVLFAEQTNNGLHVVVTVGSTTLYEENFVTSDPNHTVLDLVQTSFNVRSVRWILKYLKASKTQSAGYETIVWPSVTDTFVTTVDADKKLIIQSELDTAVGAVSSAVNAIKDGQSIDSFSDVETALSGKQASLTAGKYIGIDANNEIAVERVVPNEAFTYTIQQTGDGIVKITKTVDGAVVFDETYSGDANVTLDALQYVYNAGVQSYTLLIASDTHDAGFKQVMSWWQRVTYTENFSTVDHSGEKLIIKSELDAELNIIKDGTNIDSFGDVETALAGKQGTLTAGDYISLNNGNIAVNRNIVGDNYDYEIKSTGDYKLTIIKSQGGTVISTNTYDYSYGTSTNIDNNFTIAGAYSGGNTWVYTALKDSTTHSVGYTWTKSVDASFEETESFPSEDLSGYKLVIKSEMDTALSGKQDTLTFDDVPTDNSNNPVKSNGIYDALVLKQNATDNSLETEAKTIVGAINEHEGDIGSLKSGLTTLDNEVNGDAVEYPYADVITIEDAIPANLADCSVKIEPVQDLHGYDKPWVGGAGKNKWDVGSNINEWIATSDNGVKIISNGDISSRVTANFNTSTGSIEVTNYDNTGWWWMSKEIKLAKNTNYKLINLSVTMKIVGLSSLAGGTTGTEISITDGAFNSGNYDYWIVSIYPYQLDVTNTMVMLATETDATFAPYTNICPITGHTEASVQRVGVNQWDEDWEQGGIDDTDGSKTSASNQIRSKNYIPCMANTDYYVSAPANTISTYIYYYASDYSFIGRAGQTGAYNVSEKTITTPVNCAYMMMKAGTLTSYGNNISINYPSSITAYTPYVAGKTYTIALGDTIYGGTVDFDSGVMTVDRESVDLGSLSWTKYQTVYYAEVSDSVVGTEGELPNIKCSCYKTVTTVTGQTQMLNKDDASITNNASYARLYVKDTTNYADATEFTTAMDGMTATYELATPTTIQLTPQQIQLLKGQNTLTASTGDISVTVNGVSGAIGAVQSEVNELAEDVAEIKPLNYSTTEQKTGQKWIDGKDIYFKTVEFGALPNKAKKSVDSGLTGETIIKMYGIAKSGNDYTTLPSTATNAIYTVTLGYDAAEHQINIYTATDMTSYSGFVVLEYTKETT